MPRQLVNPNFNYEPTEYSQPLDLSEVTTALESVKRAIESKEVAEVVEVSNLDYIKKYLREELAGVIKAVNAIDIPEPSKKIEVTNFPKQEKTEEVKVNNLSELSSLIEKLIQSVHSLNVNPIVNVPAPIVNIPEQQAPIVNVPPPQVLQQGVDLSPILAKLDPLKLLSRDPNKPITVRMSDGRSFIDAIANTLKENGDRLATVVSTSYGLTKDEYKAAQNELQTTLRNGMSIPYHNSQVIDEADPDDVTITYKLNGTTVATKRIQVVGTTTTITVS